MSEKSICYTTIGEHEELSVELPHGIGVVRIRTGNVQGRTGLPVVAVEVVSDTIDRPAEDGRFYMAEYSSMQETVYLVGHPDSEGET